MIYKTMATSNRDDTCSNLPIEKKLSRAIKASSLGRHMLRCFGLLTLTAATSVGAFAEDAVKAAPGTKTTTSYGTVQYLGTVNLSDLPSTPPMLKARPTGKGTVHKHLLPNSFKPKAAPYKYPKLSPNTDVKSIKTHSSNVPGFIGITSIDNLNSNGGGAVEPPDQGLAVFNNQVAEITNDIVKIYNLGAGSQSRSYTTSEFFGEGDPLGAQPFDGQVFFDPTVQRWFFIADNSTFNGIVVAVSTTNDAMGEYNRYNFLFDTTTLPGCDPSGCFPDYPKGGYDQNAFFISANLFNGDTFVNAATFVITKADLVSGQPAPRNTRVDYPITQFVVQPSVPAPGQDFLTEDNGTEMLLEAGLYTGDPDSVWVWQISNTGAMNDLPFDPTALNFTGSLVDVQSYSLAVPATQPSNVDPMCSPFNGGDVAPQLEGEFSAFQSTVQLAGNLLFGVLPSGDVDSTGFDRNILSWFVFTPVFDGTGLLEGAEVVNQGTIVPPNGYSLLNPAFGLNNSGNGILGFSITSPNGQQTGGFPSTAILNVADGIPGLVDSSIYVTGVGTNTDQGFTGCFPDNTGAVARWGDYGAATVDSATGIFYAANEYIPPESYWAYNGDRSTNWGTFITQIYPFLG